MATTTNYGWTTPDDTALVKDGASAIRTLGSSVDTTVKALSPGTTAGDVDYYTSSTAKARLAIGTTGQVLTVAGGVPSWATPAAGGMTLLSTTTLSGASTTISSISQSYTKLLMMITNVNTSASTYLRLAPNGVTNLSSYYGPTDLSSFNAGENSYYRISVGNIGLTNTTDVFIVDIDFYSQTSYRKQISTTSAYYNSTFGGILGGFSNGTFNSTDAISSLVISLNSGTMSAGTVLLYGVK